MKISKLIETLNKIKDQFGDISITGGSMVDDGPLHQVCVTNMDGMEIWPRNPNGLEEFGEIDGIFFQS